MPSGRKPKLSKGAQNEALGELDGPDLVPISWRRVLLGAISFVSAALLILAYGLAPSVGADFSGFVGVVSLTTASVFLYDNLKDVDND